MASRSHTYHTNRSQQGKNRNQHGRKTIYRASVDVKKDHVGHLIGRSGSAIRGLQQKYGIRSKIDEKNLRYLLSGPKRNVDAAVAEIRQTIVKLNQSSQPPRTRRMVTDDDGWTHTEEKRQVQPRRQVAKLTVIIPKNRFDFGDSSDEEEDETECNVPTADYKEHKPTGQWANGVAAAVKEEGETRLSKAMLKQRLSVAEDALAKAEKALVYHQSQDTGSWADEADIADAEVDVHDAQALVYRLRTEIENY